MLEEADIDAYLSSGVSDVDWKKKLTETQQAIPVKKKMRLKHVNLEVPPIMWAKAGESARARGITLYAWYREALARQIQRDLGVPMEVTLADCPPPKRDYGKTAWQRAKEAEDAGT